MTVSPNSEGYDLVEKDEWLTEKEKQNRRQVIKLIETVRLLEEFNKAVADAGMEMPVFRPTMKIIRKKLRS